MHVLDATSLSRSPVAGWGRRSPAFCVHVLQLAFSLDKARPGERPHFPSFPAPAPARACIYRSPHRHHRSVGARPRLSKQDWPKTPRPHELIGMVLQPACFELFASRACPSR
jgi:hypothetical protein